MEKKDLKEIIADISYLVEENDVPMILNIILDLHPADLAEILHYLKDENRDYIFQMLDAETASEVMAEMDETSRDDILEDMDSERLSEIVDEMDSDDATDLVKDLPHEVAAEVLARIDKQDSDEVRELLRHPEETAGGIMAKEFISIQQNSTVDEAIQAIRKKSEEVENVYYVYVVDADGKLVGIVSLKDLILTRDVTQIAEIMEKDVISVNIHLDQEEVANIVKRYDLVAIPVVDEKGVLVGRITIDDIVDVIEEEASEDMKRMAGISDEEEIRETSPFRIMKVRLPWMLVGFVGELVSAVVLQHFKASLNQIIAAAFFIPIIMAMGGNAGIQTSTIMVRGLATGEISTFHSGRRLRREFLVSLLISFICAILIFSVISLWLHMSKFGLILAISMMVVIINASLVGALVPLLLKKTGVDPAIASGPFITTTNDVLGLLIYLALVTTFIRWI